MAGGLTLSVTMERRAAEVTTNAWVEKKYGVAVGTHKCHVLGLFQYTDEMKQVLSL